jgi:hypothetical protein
VIRFAFYIHNHQPVGNFDEVFDFAYTHSYYPLLRALLDRPQVKFGIHNSGPLCEWLEQHHPEYCDLLRTAVKSGQAEILASAFGEPILSLIPKRDAVEQIKYFKDYIDKKFACDVRGLWLTERVWEPSMIAVLNEAGIEYTLLDDTHFRFAGLGEDDLYSYYLTEDENRLLKVFPIDMRLRYLIPFHQLNETFDFLKVEAGKRENALKTLGDDGEKFGVWPGTYDWVHNHGWLTSFLNRLLSEAGLETVLLKDLLREPPAGRVYLPTASYEEMGEWSLPIKAGNDYEELKRSVDKRFFYLIRGGYFKNFLSKYPEANLMQKRMTYVSQNIGEEREAKLALWRGECSCVYWHGIFGGLYLPHLREAVYKNLIEAESFNLRPDIKSTDFDADGRDELVVSDRNFFGVLRPATGSFIELDDRQRLTNLLNYIGRRPEKYHARIPPAADNAEVKSIHEIVRSKESDLGKYLVYDRYDRGFALDWRLPATPRAEDFYRGNTGGEIIAYAGFDILGRDPVTIRFQPAGKNSLEKTVRLINDEQRFVEIAYRAGDESAAIGRLGVEFSLGLFNPRLRIGDNISLHELQSLEDLNSFDINGDNLRPIVFAATEKFSLRAYPIETISSSESGFERNFQGFTLLLVFDRPAVIRIKL